MFLGADFKLHDDEGQNIVHFAASSGQLMLISYFHKFLDMSIDPEDFSGLTPLHLAAKEGQEQSATLLIAWSGDLDRKDSEGMTPLHYAALANSYRIVRHLLMKGASRDSLNNSQATPFRIAQRSQASPDVVGMLEEPCFLVKCNPVKPPLRPVKSSSLNFIFYIVLFVLRYFLVFLFVVPGVNEFLGIASFGVFSVSFVLFQMVSNMDPGYVKKDDMNLLDLYEKYNGDFVCPYCETRRSHHIKHCQHCDKCVRKYDHHCPWINNCVGENNRKMFFIFLLITEIDFLYHSIIGLLDKLGVLSTGKPLFHEIFENEPYHSMGKTIALAVSIFCGLAFLFVVPLFYVQLINLIKDKTTYERFAHQQRGRVSNERLLESDTSSMMLMNEVSLYTPSRNTEGMESIFEVHRTCCCSKRKKEFTGSQLQEASEE
mgnify:FL=1